MQIISIFTSTLGDSLQSLANSNVPLNASSREVVTINYTTIDNSAVANRGMDYYRLRNIQVSSTYLFVNQSERDSALARFPELFVDEGIAFEVAVA